MVTAKPRLAIDTRHLFGTTRTPRSYTRSFARTFTYTAAEAIGGVGAAAPAASSTEIARAA